MSGIPRCPRGRVEPGAGTCAGSLRRLFNAFTEEHRTPPLRLSSERGAYGCGFLFLYAALTNSPLEIDSKLQEFQNKVIHKGHLVRTPEVERYGQGVFELVRRLMEVLSTNHSTEMWAEINEEAERRKAATTNAGSTLWIGGDEWDRRKSLSFEVYLGELRSKRKGA